MTVNTLHFNSLNLILLVLLQVARFVKVCCNRRASSSQVIFLNVFVSSAYKAVSDFSGMMSGKSLMNNTNNIGPSMLPCGTPDVTEADQPEEEQDLSYQLYIVIDITTSVNG